MHERKFNLHMSYSICWWQFTLLTGRWIDTLIKKDTDNPISLDLRQWMVRILRECIIIFNCVHRHHHILTLVTWCSWCWTIRYVSSFNYVYMHQFTYTNTKMNRYLRIDSRCCRDANKYIISEIFQTDFKSKWLILTVGNISSGNILKLIN